MNREQQRLRWACRRGMRELDLCLLDFLNNGWLALSDPEKQDFKTLLAYQDQDLLDWLLGNTQPTNRAIGNLIVKIQSNR